MAHHVVSAAFERFSKIGSGLCAAVTMLAVAFAASAA
jgi:hypothetical protein